MTATSISLLWDVLPSASTYIVSYRTCCDSGTLTVSGTSDVDSKGIVFGSHTLTGRSSSVTYQIYVTSSNNYGNQTVGMSAIVIRPSRSVPSVPVSAMVASSNGSHVILIWTADASATIFTVKKKIISASTWTTVVSDLRGSAYVVAEPGELRTFQIAVFSGNSNGYEAVSTSFSIDPDSFVPKNISYVAVAALTSSSISLQWPQSPHATQYSIESLLTSDTSGSTRVVQTVVNLTTSATITGLTGSQAYVFIVRPGNNYGFHPIGASVIIQTTSSVPASAPANISAILDFSGNAAAGSVYLTWSSVVTASKYKVEKRFQALWETVVSDLQATSYTVVGLSPGAQYFFRVTAGNPNGYESSGITTPIVRTRLMMAELVIPEDGSVLGGANSTVALGEVST